MNGRTNHMRHVVLEAIQLQPGSTRWQLFNGCERDFGQPWSTFKRVMSMLISEGLVDVNQGPDPGMRLTATGVALVDPVE
jgi:predicted transcriptional regulator